MEGSQSHEEHPYIPRDLKLPGFVPGVLSQSTIIGFYAVSALLVVSTIFVLSGRSPKRSKTERWLMCWWAFTGLTHMILEGYFVFLQNFIRIKLLVTWLKFVRKEYSKGDSRYAARDAGVVAVEGLTAVLEGPASLLAV
ncbi:putative 3-beta-hydroxysteroid-delta(8) [Quercus suber]|uniref:3-beta-hydroxysteroid-delta(8) n=1 Tax=Quercus suber TaxID=58331 RepID=A0AAW0JTR2_QUESU